MRVEEVDGHGVSRPRLLLVDDDSEILEELSEGLLALGLPSRTARTGIEALELVVQHAELDILVTDLEMPRIDGIELLQKLAARRRARPVFAIVMTGSASLDRAVAALRLNAVDFLQKPVAPEEVAIAVRRAMKLTEVDPGAGADGAPRLRSDYLRAVVAARTDREQIFKSDVFSDPAWEVLLDLAMAEASGRFVSVTSLCLASGVATTTALRRMDELQDLGLIERFPDGSDRRRTLVRLTEVGRSRMGVYLEKQAARLGIRLD